MNSYQRNAYRTDALISHGAAAAGRRFPLQKKYAAEAGVDKSTASRHMRGDKYSPMSHYLRGVLIVGYPLVAEGLAVLEQANHQRSTEQLWLLRAKLNELEHGADCESDRHALRAAFNPTAEQLSAAADADVHAAEICLERAAVLRELAERVRRG